MKIEYFILVGSFMKSKGYILVFRTLYKLRSLETYLHFKRSKVADLNHQPLLLSYT